MGSTGKKLNYDYYDEHREVVNTSDDKSSNYESDVATKTTPMSKADVEIVGGGNWSTRYFQTANAFRLNECLRRAAKEGISIEQALKDSYGSGWREQMRTVEAMDRNMRPTNADMEVVRKAGYGYLASVLKQATGKNFDKDSLRFMSPSELKDLLSANKSSIVGGTLHENAFSSCTFNKSLSDSAFRGRDITINTTIVKGTRGIFSPTGEESEFVVSRTTGFELTNIEVTNSGKIIINTKTIV